MKLYLYFIAALLLVGGVAWYIMRVPASHPLHFGVSFSQRGYQTNAIGTIAPVYAVTNGGLRKVNVYAGTEFGVNAVDFSGSSLPRTLQPGEEMLVSLVPSASYSQSRPVVLCNKFYSGDAAGQARRWLDVYLMKRQVTEHVYLAERTK